MANMKEILLRIGIQEAIIATIPRTKAAIPSPDVFCGAGTGATNCSCWGL